MHHHFALDGTESRPSRTGTAPRIGATRFCAEQRLGFFERGATAEQMLRLEDEFPPRLEVNTPDVIVMHYTCRNPEIQFAKKTPVWKEKSLLKLFQDCFNVNTFHLSSYFLLCVRFEISVHLLVSTHLTPTLFTSLCFSSREPRASVFRFGDVFFLYLRCGGQSRPRCHGNVFKYWCARIPFKVSQWI